MLGLRRNPPTRGEQITSELGECRDHLREAASLIAGGAAERLAPRVEQARGAVGPKMEKARGAALHGLENMTVALGGEKRKARWPLMVGALGVGVVAGAIGALMMARRNGRWDEYEPVTVFGEENAEKVERVANSVKSHMHDLGDSVRDAAGNVKETVKNAAENVASSAKKTTKS